MPQKNVYHKEKEEQYMAKTLPPAEVAIITWARIAVMGAVFAVVLWLLSLGISHFIVEPLTCGVNGGANQCRSALDVSSGIAAILMAVGATFAGIWLGIARPLFVAVSAAVMLWGLANWLDGLFWLEAFAWSVLAGALVFALFSWLNRTQSIIVTLILTIVVVIAERVVLALP